MLWHAYYAWNYAGIIGASLIDIKLFIKFKYYHHQRCKKIEGSRLTVVSREAKEEVPRDERTWVFYKNKPC